MTKRGPSRLAAALLLLLLGAHCVRAGAESVAKAFPVTQAPKIDGRLTDMCWQVPPVACHFTVLGSGEAVTQDTSVWLGYTQTHLYVAAVMQEDRMDRLVANVTKRDGPVWEDDCFELFLAPDAGSPQYYHFVVNAGGVLRDEAGQDESWNSETASAAMKQDRSWSVELAIPLKDLGLTAAVTDRWRGNFCREERPHGEVNSWSPTTGGFHDPKAFGVLDGLRLDVRPFAQSHLEQQGHRLLQALDDQPPAGAPEPMRQEVAKLTAALRSTVTKATLFPRGELQPLPVLRKAGETLQSAQAGVDRRTRLVRLAKMAAEAGVSGDAPFLFCQESAMTKVRPDQPYQGKPTRSVTAALAGNEYEPIQLVLVGLRDDLGKVKVDVEAPGNDGRRLQVTTNVVGTVHVTQPTRGGGGPGDYPDPLLPYEPFDLQQGKPRSLWLTLYAERGTPAGQYRGSVTLTPERGSPVRIGLEARVFGFELPVASRLRTLYNLGPSDIARRHKVPGPWFRRANADGYAAQPDGVFRTDRTAAQGKWALEVKPTDGRWVHIATPYLAEADQIVEVSYYLKEPGQTFSLFLGGTPNRGLSAKEQEPGKWHRAMFRVADSGLPEGETASPEFLSENPELKSHSFLVDNLIAYRQRQDGTREVAWQEDFEQPVGDRLGDLIREYRLNALRHRACDGALASPGINIDDRGKVTMNWADFDREVQFYLDHGQNAFNCPWVRIGSGWGEVTTPQEERELSVARQVLQQTQAHLKEKGWLDLAYIYVIDEPGAKAFDGVKRAFQLAGEHAPGLKRLLTFGYGATRPWTPGAAGLPAYADLKGYVDIWVPHIDCFDPKFLDTLRGKDRNEIWHYICISAQLPYPNMWAIDYPGVVNRVVYWQLWQHRIEGFLYWATTYWQKDVWEDPLSYPGGNGDGSLLYWGKTGPVNSIRYELIRDGTEDYDMLALLSDLAKTTKDANRRREAERLLNLGDLTPEFTRFPSDPQALEARRLAVAEMIERLTASGK